jgi:segregation and condensation protein B
MTSPSELEAVVEAALFAAPEPLTRARLVGLFSERERDAAGAAIDRVLERYAEAPERGVRLEEVAGGLRLVTKAELHGYLRRLFSLTGANRLSMAALETLAIVAYRQPITGPEIQELRGVNSSGVLKTLLERRLVRISGRKMVVGKPFLYATTREFLIQFGLAGLDDLPPLEEFETILGELGEGGDEGAEQLEVEDETLGPEPLADPDEVVEDSHGAGGAEEE